MLGSSVPRSRAPPGVFLLSAGRNPQGPHKHVLIRTRIIISTSATKPRSYHGKTGGSSHSQLELGSSHQVLSGCFFLCCSWVVNQYENSSTACSPSEEMIQPPQQFSEMLPRSSRTRAPLQKADSTVLRSWRCWEPRLVLDWKMRLADLWLLFTPRNPKWFISNINLSSLLPSDVTTCCPFSAWKHNAQLPWQRWLRELYVLWRLNQAPGWMMQFSTVSCI